jgi:NADPH:quinone reductase-like Zn-dependent oxidoreductase
MKAVVVEKYGSPEGLRIREVETPIPKDNELLVKINATTVTYGDAALRRMRFPVRMVFGLFMGGLGKNKILGHELAGEVEAVGDKVTQFKEGDQVFASTGMTGGAHAEYICLPEDSMVASKPTNILREANIQSGQKVLIYGASGSVGTYAVQLAKYWGAEVTGVCSTSNLEWVRDLGADKMIDYKKEDFIATDETYKVIFDAVRKISSSQCKGLLKEDGVFLSTRSPTKEKAENLVFLRELIEGEKFKSVIDRRYPLEDIIDAHSYVDQGHKKGNVVIVVNPDSKVV